jgi:hypothetical protein
MNYLYIHPCWYPYLPITDEQVEKINTLTEDLDCDLDTPLNIEDEDDGQDLTMDYTIYHLLGPLFGYKAEHIHLWLTSYNKHLKAKPEDLVKTDEGLEEVIEYLSRIRQL